MSEGAWWDAFCEAGGIPDLETWLGGVDHVTRLRIRERVAECRFESVLDCGAGLGLDWVGFSNLSHECEWSGIEPSAAMRETANSVSATYGKTDLAPIIEGSIEAIPYPNESFEFVYCRHVLEHLPRFEGGLREMIRVAEYEAVVVFFMRPGAETYLFRERDGLWQNRYAKHEIDAFLQNEPRAFVWFWEHVASEVLLHVYTTNAAKVTPERVAERLAHR